MALTGGLIAGISLPGRLLVFLIGQTVYAFSLAMLIRCQLGMNGLDSLLHAAQARLGISYSILRWGADLALTVLGCLVGGIAGVGTVISIVTTGPLIHRDVYKRQVRAHQARETHNPAPTSHKVL